MTHEEKVAFAEQGKAVLKNPAYEAAMTARKAKIFEAFCNSGPEDTERREEYWRSMRNILSLEADLKRILTDGKIANQQIELERN